MTAMYILALDTACGRCSVAVYGDGEERSFLVSEQATRQAEQLIPMIEQALEQAEIGYSDLDVVAVTIGPGSFTGVRIGLATARGIALASGTPLMGITTLECMAYAALPDTSDDLRVLAVAQDARRDQFYFQCFDRSLNVIDEPVLVDTDEIALRIMEEGAGGVTVISDQWQNVASQLQEDTAIEVFRSDVTADAALLARRAYERITQQDEQPSAEYARHVRPLYIRPPDAKLPNPVMG